MTQQLYAEVTPKRKVRGSNPRKDAKNNAESLCLRCFSALFFYPSVLQPGTDYPLRAFGFISVADTISLKILDNQISKKTPFLLMKIAFLLIVWEIVLKILLIEMCAYNSPTLFYSPVPFNLFIILC